MDELLDSIKGENEVHKESKAVKHNKSKNENCQTLVWIPHDWFIQATHYLQQKAKNSNFDVFIAMGSITQPPVWSFDNPTIEEAFFRGITNVLFTSKLAMMQRIAPKQRDANTGMENILNP